MASFCASFCWGNGRMHSSHRIQNVWFCVTALALLAACVFFGASEQRAQAETTVSVGYFDGALLRYGHWVDDPEYGRVWRPSRVPAGWRPYTHGSWVYTRDYGWVWVSDEPYGWVVYHYGRWVWSSHSGWVWVAGYEWAPAWVEWCYGGGYVGWAPMPPDPYWQGTYYYGSYDCSSPAYYSHAVFVSETYYGRPGMSSHYEPASRNAVAARATVNVTSYGRGSSGIANRSVDVKKLEAATGHPIEAVSVVQTSAPVPLDGGAPTTRQLKIFRPSVAGLTAPKLEAPSSMRLDQGIQDFPASPSVENLGERNPQPPLSRPDTEGVPSSIERPSGRDLSVPDLSGRSIPGGGLGGGGLLGR
jgi:uncharacterized protein DUF6600